MTDEELAAIRARLSVTVRYGSESAEPQAAVTVGDAAALVAEVARLNAEARRMTALHAQTVEELDAARAEVERLRILARAIAAYEPEWDAAADVRHCVLCGAESIEDSDDVEHELGCPLVVARELAKDEDDHES